MRIRYYCPFGKTTGYGRAARDYLLALHQVDEIELEIAVLGDELVSPEPRYSALDPLAVPYDRVVGTPDVAIYHAPPRVLATVLWPEQRPTVRVAMTTWETTPLPWQYADVLGAFDATIVPSEFCRDVIAAAETNGFDHPSIQIHVVPHCFDETFWPLVTQSRDSHRPTRFYSIGVWGERKNHLGVIRAYLHEFTKADRVQLMLMIQSPDLDEIRSVIARAGLPAEQLPELHVPSEVQLSEDQLVELHAEGDCFVSAARGEGWGLGMFEAAIAGKNVISTSWGGQLEFLKFYANWLPIPHQLTPCFGSENRQRVEQHEGHHVQVSRVAIPPGVDCKQKWAEPDLVALGKAMRHVHEMTRPPYNVAAINELRTGRAALEAQFGYKAIGPKLATLLRGLTWPSPMHSTT